MVVTWIYKAMLAVNICVFVIQFAMAQHVPKDVNLVGLWYFDKESQGIDLSGNENHAEMKHVVFVTSPLGVKMGAAVLPSGAASSITIPNGGKLDVRHSFTLMIEVRSYCDGSGPIFQWGEAESLGVHVWEFPACDLHIGLTNRVDELIGTQLKVRGALSKNKWTIITVTYNGEDNRLAVWVDGKILAEHVYLQSSTLGTFNRINLGGKFAHSSRQFATEVFTAKLFNDALKEAEIKDPNLRYIYCPAGNYGPPFCTGRCHCVDEPCERINGTCQNGCETGWTGSHCEKGCQQRTWGPGCESICHCPGNESCNVATGVCPPTCAKGWSGPACQINSGLPVTTIDPTPRITFNKYYFALGCSILGIFLLTTLVGCVVFYTKWRAFYRQKKSLKKTQKLLRHRQLRQVVVCTDGKQNEFLLRPSLTDNNSA